MSDYSGFSDDLKSSQHSSGCMQFVSKVEDFEFAPIQNNDVVELSAVENAKTIWIRGIKYDEKYCELMSKINANVDDPVTELENNTVVLIKYSGDHSRGIVLDKEKICIRLMDIGSKVDADIGK